MAAGESQDCSWAARGCVRSLLFVLFSYASKAALRTNWKLEEEEEEDAMGGFRDMVCIERERRGWWVAERGSLLSLFRGCCSKRLFKLKEAVHRRHAC